MNIANMPQALKEQWFQAARDQYSKKPLIECRDYELQALRWYWDLMTDGFSDEPPQSYEEALLYHQYHHNWAQVNLEIARRAAERAERWLRAWESRRGAVQS